VSDPQFDVVIVGSGVGGLTAAITAKLAGLKPLLAEKTPLIGGSSALSGGVLWLPNNVLMQREGIADSREDGLRYLGNFVPENPIWSTEKRREAYVDSIGPMIAMLEEQGMRYQRCHGYSDYYDTLPGGNAAGRSIECPLFNSNRLGTWKAKFRPPSIAVPICSSESARFFRLGFTMEGKLFAAKVAGRLVWSKLTGRTMYNAGASLQGRMLEVALRLGIDIWTDAGLVDLDRQDGKVIGAQLNHEGRPVTVRASRGVIVTAGGFAHNLDMRERYQPKPTSDKWTVSNPGDTGEAIEAMARAGAGLALMDQSWWTPVFFPPDNRPQQQIIPELQKPHGIMVDANGERFVNEANSYMELGRAMYERNKTAQAVPAWAVFDRTARKRHFFGFQPPGGFPKKWKTSGVVKMDDTIAGLARQCGIDPDGLQRTIERFNGFARAGVDEDYGRGNSAYNRYYADPTNKPNASLGPLEKPPFWAAQLWPGDVGTSGGAMTNEHGQVIREDGTPIDGLYAAGNCTASLAGPYYVGAGQSIGTSSVFGYLAVKHAGK